MKLTKKYLEQLIKEECAAMIPNGVAGGAEDEIVADDEEEYDREETDLEGLAHRAIASIYDLATAAGANISIDGGSGDGEEEISKIAEIKDWSSHMGAEWREKHSADMGRTEDDDLTSDLITAIIAKFGVTEEEAQKLVDELEDTIYWDRKNK